MRRIDLNKEQRIKLALAFNNWHRVDNLYCPFCKDLIFGEINDDIYYDVNASVIIGIKEQGYSIDEERYVGSCTKDILEIMCDNCSFILQFNIYELSARYVDFENFFEDLPNNLLKNIKKAQQAAQADTP